MRRSGAMEMRLHGGKDGHPYPVYREVYERSIEKLEAFKRLDNFRRDKALR